MKMADMVSYDAAMLSVLRRFGIPLGFGDATVADVCSRYGVSESLFMTVASVYTDKNYNLPSDLAELGQDDLPVIVGFLKASHDHYVSVSFPRLHKGIHSMLEICDSATADVLNRFFDDYEAQELEHFKYEESEVFPYMESLVECAVQIISDVNFATRFQENHQNIGGHLTDLKNIIIKYMSSSYSSDIQIEVLEQIFSMEADTVHHARIEENVLLPLVRKLLSKK